MIYSPQSSGVQLRDALATKVRPADHPLRSVLAGELHARPVAALRAPQRCSHLAMLSGEGDFAADFAHLVELCRRHRVAAPEPAKHFSVDFGSFLLKWERHGEFCTYSFYRPGSFRHPFEQTALDLVPADWLQSLPGQRLVAVHLALEAGAATLPTPGELKEYLHDESLVGSHLSGGAATVWTDFWIHADGFSRILISAPNLEPLRAGRMVQRLLEIETYRMMALLALPLAQTLCFQISRIEARMSEITGRLAENEGLEETRGMLAQLSRLWVEIEGTTARASFRFDATRAYYDLVLQRTERLREKRIEGLQTIGEFLERRMAPAMSTCAATARRIEGLARRLARATGLLNTQVDVALEGQNRDLLANMDRRAGMQAQLQRTLELISIFALTYYLSALLGLAIRALNRSGLGFDVELITGAAIPAMFIIGWLGLRWARQAIIQKHDGGTFEE
jgi:uncharacterized membrane-anchored protein